MAASKQKLRTRSPSLQWFWIQDDVFIRSRVVYSRAVLVPSLDCRLTKFKSFKVFILHWYVPCTSCLELAYQWHLQTAVALGSGASLKRVVLGRQSAIRACALKVMWQLFFNSLAPMMHQTFQNSLANSIFANLWIASEAKQCNHKLVHRNLCTTIHDFLFKPSTNDKARVCASEGALSCQWCINYLCKPNTWCKGMIIVYQYLALGLSTNRAMLNSTPGNINMLHLIFSFLA